MPFAKPLARTREYIGILRDIWARAGAGHERRRALPAAAAGRHRAGQAAEVLDPPAARGHPDLPRRRGAEEHRAGRRAVRRLAGDALLAAARGLLPRRARPRASRARARAAAPTTSRSPRPCRSSSTDDVEAGRRHAAARSTRCTSAAWGRRARTSTRTSRSAWATRARSTQIQDLYLAGKKDEAAAAIPRELIEQLSLIGPPDKIRARPRAVARVDRHDAAGRRRRRDAAHRRGGGARMSGDMEPITAQGLEDLKAELERLEGDERRALAERDPARARAGRPVRERRVPRGQGRPGAPRDAHPQASRSGCAARASSRPRRAPTCVALRLDRHVRRRGHRQGADVHDRRDDRAGPQGREAELRVADRPGAVGAKVGRRRRGRDAGRQARHARHENRLAQLLAGVDPELLVDVAQVVLDGLRAEEDRRGRLARRPALREQLRDLQLLRGELVERAGVAPPGASRPVAASSALGLVGPRRARRGARTPRARRAAARVRARAGARGAGARRRRAACARSRTRRASARAARAPRRSSASASPGSATIASARVARAQRPRLALRLGRGRELAPRSPRPRRGARAAGRRRPARARATCRRRRSRRAQPLAPAPRGARPRRRAVPRPSSRSPSACAAHTPKSRRPSSSLQAPAPRRRARGMPPRGPAAPRARPARRAPRRAPSAGRSRARAGCASS